MRHRPLLVLFALMVTVSFAPAMARKKPLDDVTLRWTPTTKVAEFGIGAIDLTALQNTRIEVGAFTDARGGPPELIGENREDADEGVVLPVSTRDSIAEYCRSQLQKFLVDLGLPIVESGGTAIITAEVRELKVVEESTYVASVLLSVAVSDPGGELRWKGLLAGSAKRFGRSYSAQNYIEALSDALLDADAALARSQEFLDALHSSGVRSASASPAQSGASSPPAPKAQSGSAPRRSEVLSNQDIVAMAAAGLGDTVILAKVQQGQAESFDVSVDALLALKKQGVSQPVIEAMIKKSEGRRPSPVASSVEAPKAASDGAAKPAAAASSGSSGSVRPLGEVKLYFADKPAGTYRELGRVSAQKYNMIGISRKRSDIDADLKKEAARLGANAVINITEDFAGVSGVAVVVADP